MRVDFGVILMHIQYVQIDDSPPPFLPQTVVRRLELLALRSVLSGLGLPCSETDTIDHWQETGRYGHVTDC